MNNRRNLFIALLILTTMLACAVPGLSAAPDSAPLMDTGQLETLVAGTVSASVAQTQQVAPTPTLHLENTPEQNTPEPTATATPAAEVALPGSSLAAQTDGTTLFTDNLAKFQLNISPGWLPVRINEQEHNDAFSLDAFADPAAQRILTDIKTLDPNSFRLVIYDLQDGHLEGGVLTNISLVWNPDGSVSLDGEAGIKGIADTLPATVPHLEVTSFSVSSTANDIPIGAILSEMPGKTFLDTDVMLLQKQVYLNLLAGSLTITFTTEQNFKDATLPFFDSMVETIKINQ